MEVRESGSHVGRGFAVFGVGKNVVFMEGMFFFFYSTYPKADITQYASSLLVGPYISAPCILQVSAPSL
jgi:hypothetical protein